MEYQDAYGRSVYSPKGRKPDFTRCAAPVAKGWHVEQCGNKAKYDPDEHGNPTTCGIHSDKSNQHTGT